MTRLPMDQVTHNKIVSFIWSIADVHLPEPGAMAAPEIAEAEDGEKTLQEAA